jgi:hypothetical protein
VVIANVDAEYCQDAPDSMMTLLARSMALTAAGPCGVENCPSYTTSQTVEHSATREIVHLKNASWARATNVE